MHCSTKPPKLLCEVLYLGLDCLAVKGTCPTLIFCSFVFCLPVQRREGEKEEREKGEERKKGKVRNVFPMQATRGRNEKVMC